MSEIKQKVISEKNDEINVEVQADSVEDFLNSEIERRINIIDDQGPFGPNQVAPFITHKQNIPIYIVIAICCIAHIWAYVTIGI